MVLDSTFSYFLNSSFSCHEPLHDKREGFQERRCVEGNGEKSGVSLGSAIMYLPKDLGGAEIGTHGHMVL